MGFREAMEGPCAPIMGAFMPPASSTCFLTAGFTRSSRPARGSFVMTLWLTAARKWLFTSARVARPGGILDNPVCVIDSTCCVHGCQRTLCSSRAAGSSCAMMAALLGTSPSGDVSRDGPRLRRMGCGGGCRGLGEVVEELFPACTLLDDAHSAAA